MASVMSSCRLRKENLEETHPLYSKPCQLFVSILLLSGKEENDNSASNVAPYIGGDQVILRESRHAVVE